MKTACKITMIILITTLMTGCMHRMADHEVRDVTTCDGASKREIVKNLLLSGYTIDDEDDDYIVTDYKQVSGSRWQRVSFVKEEDRRWRFHIRKRHEYESQVPVASTTVTTTRKSRHARKKRQTVQKSEVYQTVREVDEFDQTYYQEMRSDYLSFQNKVCRTHDIAGL